MLLSAYARFIVRHSYLALLTVAVVSTLLTVIPLVCHDLPSFADPIVGFETRGTTLANRFIAWENIIDETRPSRSLAVNPQEIEDQKRMNRTYYNKTRPDRPRSGHGRKRKTKKKKKQVNNNTGIEKMWYELPENDTSSSTQKKKKKVNNNTGIEKMWYEQPENDTSSSTQKRKKKVNNNLGIEKMWYEQPENDTSSSTHVHVQGYGRNVSYEDEDTGIIRDHIKKQWKQLKEMQRKPDAPHQSFPGSCGAPFADYAHLVVTTSDNTSLLTYENVAKMCKLQSILEDIGKEEYYELCQREINSDLCCPIWSVPNFIALISGKNSCSNLTKEDVYNLTVILSRCAGYFHNFTLMASCEFGRCTVPIYCSQYDAVYNLLFYMIDSNAFSPLFLTQSFVKNAMIFLPLPASSTVLPYYTKLQSSNLSYDNLVIPAIDFGLKNTLFDLWIIQDTWLIALGGFFVFLCVWVYTKSLLLTLLLFTAITYSLGIAYFLYVYVFNLEFFPFMNLLVIVVVIGIGADDAFLYVKVWNMISKQLIRDNVLNQENTLSDIKNVSSAGETILIQILEETLKHSVVAIFVTTLTTAVAFFASYVSYIPAINCFSVFAGTAVLVNFFLMISWLPISVFIINVKLCGTENKVLAVFYKAINEIWEDIRVILNRFIITCVTKLHIVFVIILGAIGIGSIIVVFYTPGLQLPDSKQFQLFQTSHPFEQYDISYRDKFLFEKFGKDIGTGSKMPLRWIWGVQAIDNGNHMDPASQGHIVFDDNFSISDPSSQVWLLNFCKKIRMQPFYQQTLGPLLPNCFIDTFKSFMDRRCIDKIDNINRTPCCETSRFPYKKEVFNFCLIKAMESMYQTPRELFLPGVAGPKFSRFTSPPNIAAIVIEYESVVPYSMSFRLMDSFFLHVENWTQQELLSAPPGMKGGWFLSDFQFYDLQRTLASGTVMALALSASLGFVVLIPATLSFVVSICSLCAMIFSATVTIAILVLSGWKLNVLESVAISTSAGLAVDFSLHYALSYTNASGSKAARVKYALTASAGPTAAAALTTGFAGIFLLRSNLLPYSQIGTFLALIMSVSWVYATFYLCSLLYIFGRTASKDKVPIEERKTVSRVSSICSGVPNLESHELEHLADSNRTNLTHSHSPSSVSDTTVVLHDDVEHFHNSKLEKKPSNASTVVNNND